MGLYWSRFGHVEPGDEMMIWCDGGPAIMKRQTFPPDLEVQERDGLYVLHDDGSPADWRYVFVGTSSHH